MSHRLVNAARTRSYHLELKGPEVTYMARQAFESARGYQLGPAIQSRLQYSMTRAQGQRHSHLYVRNGDETFANYWYSATYFERTPGSMAVALVIALSATVITVIVAVAQLDAIAEPNTFRTDSSGLLQILLAFPIAIAAASGLRQSRSIWGGVLAARIATVATVVLSLAALAVSALPELFDVGVLPKVWLAIVAGLVLTSAACLGSWLMRAVVHGLFANNQKEE